MENAHKKPSEWNAAFAYVSCVNVCVCVWQGEFIKIENTWEK